MRWRLAALLLAAWCACPAAARADSFDPVSFGVDISTLGYGITLERPLLFNLSARLVTGTLSIAEQSTPAGSPGTATFRENNVLGVADWRPYGGRWYVSAGVLFGSDHLDWTPQASAGTYTLNRDVYPVAGAGAVHAQVSYARPALYLGAGGGTGILKGLTISFDAGVVLRNGTVTSAATGPLQANAAFQADLAAVAAGFRTHIIQPVAGVGLVFRP
jgi:hypothetical protein